jgi:hypothetical protein
VTFRRAFPFIVGTAVVAGIAAGLVLIGPPSAERSRRLDEIRIGDLMQLSNAIELYWKREGMLPASLDGLAGVPDAAFRSTMDPATSEPYAYRTIDASRYELCASFEREDLDGEYNDRFWAHGAGRKCFELDAQKRQTR